MGITSVIAIFIQGFRSFASTFLRSPLGGGGGEIFRTGKKKKEENICHFEKDALSPVRGLFYCNNKFSFGRSEFLLIYSCNVDQITLQP